MAYVLRTEQQTILIESVSSHIEYEVLMSEPRTLAQDEIVQAWETEHAILEWFLVDNMGSTSPITFEDAIFYYNKVETNGNKKYLLIYNGNGNVLVVTLQLMYQKNARNARRMQDLLVFLEPDAKVFNRFILPYVTGGDGQQDMKMQFSQQIETGGAIQNVEQFQIVTNIPTGFYKNTASAPNEITPIKTIVMRGVYVYIFGANDASTTFSNGLVVVSPNGAIPNPIMAVYTTLPWAYGEI